MVSGPGPVRLGRRRLDKLASRPGSRVRTSGKRQMPEPAMTMPLRGYQSFHCRHRCRLRRAPHSLSSHGNDRGRLATRKLSRTSSRLVAKHLPNTATNAANFDL
jgi:hypothetical protein